MDRLLSVFQLLGSFLVLVEEIVNLFLSEDFLSDGQSSEAVHSQTLAVLLQNHALAWLHLCLHDNFGALNIVYVAFCLLLLN